MIESTSVLTPPEFKAIESLRKQLHTLRNVYGLVVTVELGPLQPLRMGAYDQFMKVRRVIDHVGEAAKRGGYTIQPGE